MITSVNEFKQRLQEIQWNSSAVFTTLPSNEPRIIIDANSREISIPVEFDFLAVKTDHKAETIYFEIDRYFDAQDLSEHTCVIQWKNGGNEGLSPCTALDVDTFEGKIIFGWEITSDCTKVAGPIEFSVRFYTFDELGNFAYNFNTLSAESKILDTLNANGETEPTRPSSFQVWVDKLYFLEQNCVTQEDLEGLDLGGLKDITSSDGTIKVTGTESNKNVAVAVSAESNNAIVKNKDGLYVEKHVEETFGNVIASISCGGIEAGTSLEGKTAMEVLAMILGVKDAPKTIVEFIMDNNVPAYSGTEGGSIAPVSYKLLDKNAAKYTDQGFYVTRSGEEVTSAGYQFVIVGNTNADAQVIAIPADAVIKMAYRYDLGGTNTWLAYTFDAADEANYWLPGETVNKTINGEEVAYQTYVYNIDVVGGGDAIMNTQYWRFEIEVTG